MRSDCLAAFQQPSAVQEDKFFCCPSFRKGSAGLRKIRGKATLQTQPEARALTQGLPGARGQQGCTGLHGCCSLHSAVRTENKGSCRSSTVLSNFDRKCGKPSRHSESKTARMLCEDEESLPMQE